MLTDAEREEAMRIFAKHKYDEPLVVARVTTDDERIFVVRPEALDRLPVRMLTTKLQHALGRKVWVVGASSAWADTEPTRLTVRSLPPSSGHLQPNPVR